MANQHTDDNANRNRTGEHPAPVSGSGAPGENRSEAGGANDSAAGHELSREEIEERERQIARRIRRHRIFLRILLVIVILIVLGIIIVWKVFTVEKVEVEGNRLHSAASVEKTVLAGKYSWNSLYVYARFRFGDHMDEFPYADSVQVSLDSPHVVHVDVREKEMIGYLLDSKTGQYIGFDDTGEVILQTEKEPEGYIRIVGLKPQKLTLYRNMKLEDDSALIFIKSVTAVLENYELKPDIIYVQKNGTLLLSYGGIQVNLGDSFYLNEKIVRMQQLLEKLGDRTGTLHLETWTEESTDVYFRKNEQTKIPDA